jgi:dihydrofolate reductase
MSVSLDGYIESPNDHTWSIPDEELHRHFNDLEAATDLFLYGRGQYEVMAAYWPTAEDNPAASEVEREYARIWQPKPKIVFSTTLEQVGWNSRLVRGNVAEEAGRLKAQPGLTMSVGGPGLASSFMQLGLIDEYRLYVHPVILGGGKPMFPQMREKIALRLVETHTFGSGVVLLRYQRDLE